MPHGDPHRHDSRPLRCANRACLKCALQVQGSVLLCRSDSTAGFCRAGSHTHSLQLSPNLSHCLQCKVAESLTQPSHEVPGKLASEVWAARSQLRSLSRAHKACAGLCLVAGVAEASALRHTNVILSNRHYIVGMIVKFRGALQEHNLERIATPAPCSSCVACAPLAKRPLLIGAYKVQRPVGTLLLAWESCA